MTDLREKLQECIDEMTPSQLVYLHNEYCNETNNFDDTIYDFDSFDEIVQGQDWHWVACRVFYGDFNPNDEYIKFTVYGNFKSMSEYTVEDEIYIEDIIDYIVDNNNALYNDDIQAILDEFEAIEDEAEQE